MSGNFDAGQFFSKALGGAVGIGMEGFHYIIPYATMFAVPLACVYSYISRFTIVRSTKGFSIRDDGQRTLGWKHAYLLVVAGGMLHNITDSIFRNNMRIKIMEYMFEPVINTEINHWGESLGILGWNTDSLAIAGFAIAILAVYFIMYSLSKGPKAAL